jgi:ribonuclease J
MSVTVSCYGGVREIGGNKILLEDGERRVLFDFGKGFGRYGAYFDGVFVRERSARGLLDPLSLGLVPPLRGLLREDLIPAFSEPAELSPAVIEAFWQHWQARSPAHFRDLRRDQAPPVDLILLSHAHQDHISDAQYVAPHIPACSTRMTATISKVLLDTGPSGRSGAPFLNPYTMLATGMLRADSAQPYMARPWHLLDGGFEGDSDSDPLDSGASFWGFPPSKERLGIPVREPVSSPPGSWLKYWPVDHSLLGAVGYAVETEAGWVAYTGDLRFHGQHSALSEAFAEALAGLRPVALLCEGTRLSQPEGTTESQVHDQCLQAVQAASGQLVIADFAPRHIERLRTFVSIAAETARCLLVQPKDAYLLRAMHLSEPTTTDDLLLDPHVGLYADPKAGPSKHERWVIERYEAEQITPLQVKNEPGAYILAFSLTDMADMLDVQFLRGGQSQGTYVFSNSPAYDDEQAIDLMRLWHWVEHLDLRLVGLRLEGQRVLPVAGYHASGHASGPELDRFVRRVQPEILIPIHTEEPEAWQVHLADTSIQVRLPQLGQPMSIQ